MRRRLPERILHGLRNNAQATQAHAPRWAAQMAHGRSSARAVARADTGDAHHATAALTSHLSAGFSAALLTCAPVLTPCRQLPLHPHRLLQHSQADGQRGRARTSVLPTAGVGPQRVGETSLVILGDTAVSKGHGKGVCFGRGVEPRRLGGCSQISTFRALDSRCHFILSLFTYADLYMLDGHSFYIYIREVWYGEVGRPVL